MFTQAVLDALKVWHKSGVQTINVTIYCGPDNVRVMSRTLRRNRIWVSAYGVTLVAKDDSSELFISGGNVMNYSIDLDHPKLVIKVRRMSMPRSWNYLPGNQQV